jgi:ATP-dependent Clp protease ATP-binding subunit ClpB
LNRVDEIVLFTPLLVEQIKQVIDLLLDRLIKRLEDRKISLEMTENARDFIAREAYDPVYGARPLRRYLQTHIESYLAKKILQGDIKDNDHVVIDCRDDELVLRSEQIKAAA